MTLEQTQRSRGVVTRRLTRQLNSTADAPKDRATPATRLAIRRAALTPDGARQVPRERLAMLYGDRAPRRIH
jgi:hypothetical protein